MGAKSIKKWNLNSQAVNKAGKALGIKEFVIANAGDIADTDFVCWAAETDNTITMLKATHDPDLNTLNITSADGSAL